jgi:hypothetical protein
MGNKQKTSPRPITAPGPAKDNPATTYVEKFLKLADQALAQKRRSKKTTPEQTKGDSAKAAKAGG